MYYIKYNDSIYIYKLSKDQYIIRIYYENVKKDIAFRVKFDEIINICNKFSFESILFIYKNNEIIDDIYFDHDFESYMEKYNDNIPIHGDDNFEEYQLIESDYIEKKKCWLIQHICRIQNYPSLNTYNLYALLKDKSYSDKQISIPETILEEIKEYINEKYF